MKKEELKEIRNKPEKEILLKLKKSYEELRNLRFKVKMKELKDVNQIKKTKKKIAQILTILRERLEEKGEKET